MLHNSRQVKHEPVQVYGEKLHALANDAFTKVDKAFVESQPEWGGLYCDFLCIKVM